MTGYGERAERVEKFAAERVRTLQAGYRADRPAAVAALAKLRRGAGSPPSTDAELIGLALSGPDFDLVEQGPWLDDEQPAPEEHAVFAAVTLYAVHQQSRREASMHREGYSFGRSARLLGKHLQSDTVRPRFNALATAVSWDETLHHARGLIQQFRQQSVPLDYGRFARDLFDLHEGRGDRVRMAWGRDFYRLKDPTDATPEGADSDASDPTPAA